MAVETQQFANEARAKYEASLATLKTFIGNFPAITKRVEEQDEKLTALENRFSCLQQEIAAVVAESNRVARGFETKRPSLGRGDDAKRPSLEKLPETKRASIASNDIFLETRRPSTEQKACADGRAVIVVEEIDTVEVESFQRDSQDQETANTSAISASSVSSAVSETWDPNKPAPRVPTSRVTFAENEALEEVHRYSFQEQADIFPVHGHWLPADLTSRRKSFEEARDWAKQLGGRLIHIPTGIEDVDSLDCAVVEPMGKILSPSEYISTGLVLCLDGAEHEAKMLEHWGEVLKATKFLDAGLSFALPNVNGFAYVEDLELAMEAVLKHLGYSSCVVIGKGWGGQLAAEMAGRSRLGKKIDGIVLVAPSSPAASECCNIEAPLMLIWAEDDEESPFNDIFQWTELFKELAAPTFIKDLATGGHSVPKMLKQGKVAEQVFNFVVSSLLMTLLLQVAETVRGSDPVRLPENVVRLCDELPNFLVAQIGGDVELGVANCLTSVLSDPARVTRRMKNLGRVLCAWVAEGMVEMASATE